MPTDDSRQDKMPKTGSPRNGNGNILWKNTFFLVCVGGGRLFSLYTSTMVLDQLEANLKLETINLADKH